MKTAKKVWLVTWEYRGSSFGEGYGGEGHDWFPEIDDAEAYLDEVRADHSVADHFSYVMWSAEHVREG